MSDVIISEILSSADKLGMELDEKTKEALSKRLSTDAELQSHIEDIKADINSLIRWRARLKLNSIEPIFQLGLSNVHDTEETELVAVLNEYCIAHKDPGQKYIINFTLPKLKYIDICVGLTNSSNTHGEGYFIITLEKVGIDFEKTLIDLGRMSYRYYNMKDLKSVLSSIQFNDTLGINNIVEHKIVILDMNAIYDDILQRISEIELTDETFEDLKALLKELIKLKLTDESIERMRGNFFGISATDRKAITESFSTKADELIDTVINKDSTKESITSAVEKLKSNPLVSGVVRGNGDAHIALVGES